LPGHPPVPGHFPTEHELFLECVGRAGEQHALSVPRRALAPFGPHQEAVFLPLAVVPDRIAFAIHDLHQGPAQSQLVQMRPARAQLIQVGGGGQHVGAARGVQSVSALEILTQRSQRRAVPVAHQQGALQFVALAMFLGQTETVGLAGVPVVVEVRPVMDDQRVLRARGVQRRAALFDQGLGQRGQAHVFVAIETPGRLGAGETGGGAGQGVQAGGNALTDLQVFPHELLIPSLQPGFQWRPGRARPVIELRHRCSELSCIESRMRNRCRRSLSHRPQPRQPKTCVDTNG